ncbi:hypothetical protein [Mangrovibacillus cuniculi]|uniref:ABC transporter periplasmic binding protein yphF n=1 Tax=Mangrovibacillus cuniculi TaxID=2593652 RepID=A0A7S8CB28_9BACI|nr:hypothetical protein [Mangrovibacillus cuniculi]QPC46705.1 hypothetical protein G8O30_06890 [Mangrovibacillus cuniculi]
MKKMNVLVILLLLTLLTGCMYPTSELAQNQIPYEDQLASVQMAVSKYQAENGGLLPIKTREMETPTYIKYPIDFMLLAPKYMAEAPGNAFENGGIYQYVLIDVEDNPTVKVVDLRIAETIRTIKIRIQAQGFPPFGEEIAHNVYRLRYDKIGYEEPPYVISPYSGQPLDFFITGQGEILVDYRSDLMKMMQEDQKIKTSENPLHALAQAHPVAPAYALPMEINSDGEPQLIKK